MGEHAWRPYEAYPIILEYLGVVSKKSLLDIGCGTGHLLKAADMRGLNTFGIDISEEAVKISRNVSPNSGIYIGEGEDLPFEDNSFDYITCLGALEHFYDMRRGLKEMWRVGKADSIYCIVVPNIDYLFWKIGTNKGTEQQEIREVLLSLRQWKAFFVEERFSVVEIYQDRWGIKAERIFSHKNPLIVLKKMISKTIWAILPLRYTNQFVFILKKNISEYHEGKDINNSCRLQQLGSV
jgi:ubiquinone/menaquinone biosynthesis C-methylase UbiE